MASYADMAAKGPKQTDAEKVPDAVPEILHEDSGVHTIDPLHQQTHPNIPSSYADQQLQAERNAAAAEEADREADEAAKHAAEFTQHAEDELLRLEKESGKKYAQFSEEAKASYEKWKGEAGKKLKEAKKEAKKDGKKAQEKAKQAGNWAEKNKKNPVVLGNAVVLAALGGILGIGAYRLHSTGRLTGKVVGAWAAGLGLFAVGDYFVSQFFFKKYPPKN